ncbi:MAG TPA: hypothetical protein VF952_06765 [Chloroflexia bacterium]|jgi:hypothetical protein
MVERDSRLKANPIIEAAKNNATGRVQKLVGYVGDGADGKIELYLDLNMESCIELNREDVVYFVEGEKPTEPSEVFVSEEARVVVRQNITVKSIFASGGEGCGCGEGENESMLQVAMRPKGGATKNDTLCLIKKLGCNLGCGMKYANDPLMLSACRDSCDAAERLCRAFPGSGGTVIF